MKTEYFYLSGAGIEIEVPVEMLEIIPEYGRCDDYTKCAHDEYKAVFDDITDEMLYDYLYDFGAWEDHELQDRSMNIQRVIWLLAGEYQDRLYEQE